MTSATGPPPTTAGRPFRTMTAERLLVADWLQAAGGTPVAMACPGVYWRPVNNLLAGVWPLLVVNAQPITAGPGRKTDVKDAEWMAERRRHGRLRGRVIPAKPPRPWRELPRHRTTLVQDRARVIHRVQAVLEEATITLASVVTEIRGVAAPARLEALSTGHREVTALADLARGRRRTKRAQREEALQGYFTPPQRFLLRESFSQIDDFAAAMARVSAVITQHRAAEHEAIAVLDPLAGVRQCTAESLLADIGTERTRVPNAKPVASGAGLGPGHDDSGGTRLSGKTRQGSRGGRQVRVEVAHGAANPQQTDLAAQEPRMAARRGKKRARSALGHPMLVRVYTRLTRKPP